MALHSKNITNKYIGVLNIPLTFHVFKIEYIITKSATSINCSGRSPNTQLNNKKINKNFFFVEFIKCTSPIFSEYYPH